MAEGARKGRKRLSNLREQVDEKVVSLWPTPTADSATERNKKYSQGGTSLSLAVKTWAEKKIGLDGDPILWKTPVASDASNRTFYHNSRGEPNLSGMVKLWPTPKASDSKGTGPAGSKSAERDLKRLNLKGVVMYATPQSRDWRTGSTERWNNKKRSRNLNDQCAEKSIGQLNPDWVDWLMGFPVGWTDIDKDVTIPSPPEGWWPDEPEGVPRVARDIPYRVDRLKADGNAVCPPQFYPVAKAISDIERRADYGPSCSRIHRL